MSNLEGLSVAWSPTPSRAAGENLAPQWRQRPSCWEPPPQGVPGFLCCHRLVWCRAIGLSLPLVPCACNGSPIFLTLSDPPSASHLPLWGTLVVSRQTRSHWGRVRPWARKGFPLPGPRRLLPQMVFHEPGGARGQQSRAPPTRMTASIPISALRLLVGGDCRQ